MITLSKSILLIRNNTKTSSNNCMAYWLRREDPESKPQLAVICNVVSSRIPLYLKLILQAVIRMCDSNICSLEISGFPECSIRGFHFCKGTLLC